VGRQSTEIGTIRKILMGVKNVGLRRTNMAVYNSNIVDTARP